MKSINKIIASTLLVAILSLLSSCSESIFDVGDRYKIVFWFNEETSGLLRDDNAETLTFYVNNKAVETSSTDDIYWETAPSCDDSTAIITHADLLPKNNTIFYKVTDQTGFEYFSGTRTLVTNSCNAIEIGPITKFK